MFAIFGFPLLFGWMLFLVKSLSSLWKYFFLWRIHCSVYTYSLLAAKCICSWVPDFIKFFHHFMRLTIKGGLHFLFLCFIERCRSVWSNYRPAGHNIFSGPQKHWGKICKCEIYWKVCEVTFVSLHCLRWIKCLCTRTMNRAFSVYHFCSIYLFYNQIRIGTDLRRSKPGNLRVFSCPGVRCLDE